MGKRSNYPRIEKDKYATPFEAVKPLIGWIPPQARYVEPCAKGGELIASLNQFGHQCTWASDIAPEAQGIELLDALKLDQSHLAWADYIITNPPWTRALLHPMIDHFRHLKPTWLLFDADWMHTKQAEPYAPYCAQVISVGRVKWIPGSKNTGKDNCCWYLFVDYPVLTEFTWRRG